jgi:arylsulfatase A
MRRRDFIRSLSAVGALAIPFNSIRTLAQAGAGQSPNIIFILADDQGWTDLSFPTDKSVPGSCWKYFNTPQIKSIADAGMSFTNAYAPAPICTPTRRSIQWGMTPARQRGTEFFSDFVKGEHQTIPEVLKQINPAYKAGHFGKSGTPLIGKSWTDCTPYDPVKVLKYDESDGCTENPVGGFTAKSPQQHVLAPDPDPKRAFTVTDRSISFIERCHASGNPFYLQVSHYAIHTNWQARQETIEKYKYLESVNYDKRVPWQLGAMEEELDINVGRLLKRVKDLGIEDNTYIFYSSDNGGEGVNDYDQAARPDRNYPLKARKQSLYEGGLRVPFFVKGPSITAGSACGVPVCLFDLLPTFHDLAGGKVKLAADIDGVSLKDILFHNGKGELAREAGGLVFHRPYSSGTPENYAFKSSAFRCGDYKIVVLWGDTYDQKTIQLYNLKDDIGELNDLASSMPQKRESLYKMLVTYLTKVNAERPKDTNKVEWKDFGTI